MENVNNVKFEASVKKEAECGDCGHSWSSHGLNCEDGCECFWFQPKKDVFKMQVIDLRSSVIVKVLINACDLEFDFLKTAISHTANSYHFDKNLADFRLDVTNSFNKNSDEKPVPRIECNQNFETRMFEYEMHFRDRMILLSEKEFYDLGRLIGHNVSLYKNKYTQIWTKQIPFDFSSQEIRFEMYNNKKYADLVKQIYEESILIPEVWEYRIEL